MGSGVQEMGCEKWGAGNGVQHQSVWQTLGWREHGCLEPRSPHSTMAPFPVRADPVPQDSSLPPRLQSRARHRAQHLPAPSPPSQYRGSNQKPSLPGREHWALIWHRGCQVGGPDKLWGSACAGRMKTAIYRKNEAEFIIHLLRI